MTSYSQKYFSEIPHTFVAIRGELSTLRINSVDNPHLSTLLTCYSAKKAEVSGRSKKVIHNFDGLMHIIPTIQQDSTNFLQVNIKNRKRNPQNCKQVFINASDGAKKLPRKKKNHPYFLLTKNKNMV